ncbi:isocitrate lyase/phosphoenolpyruvate mutase family protein [Nesterenkonia haasae]|uniref:isocitrate lyase/phosphoenolpyruvate mutase family protein n=1 Tax=Nesterenkonia haasae TaxID=2587813 RepID=UPI0013917FE2|nr:isocitrate lyase/phosphoenolpyruvate mutase family protein [Nesterenkonia haasae]NDK32765.1 isocitrate lyase/phosphoenolpyruvate mutase family protein [Nesterenkonia haasae]
MASTAPRSTGTESRRPALSGIRPSWHQRLLWATLEVPVSVDLENGFSHTPEDVAETVRMALSTGLAGVSIEDWSGHHLYEKELAVERGHAAVEAADSQLVVTLRAENHLHGVDDFDDTVARLSACGRAGADVVYAPGLSTTEQIATVVSVVETPVNVLVRPGVPKLSELTEIGVGRVSVGGSFAFAAYQALAEAASEFMHMDTYGFLDAASTGSALFQEAFPHRPETDTA